MGATLADLRPHRSPSAIREGRASLSLGKLIIFASGNKAEIGNVPKKDGKDFADLVRERIASAPGSAVPSTHAVHAPAAHAPAGSGSLADELKKLAELRDAGVLTEDEFAAQKVRLLG